MTTDISVFSLDQRALDAIERKFQEKRQLAQAREEALFGIFQEPLSSEELWALKFLYAYMPINDLADYDGTLFLSHVRRTLDIRRQVPWGSRVPDHLFLHYVLPYRINTENIEDSRGIFYEELAERTAGLSMEEAILETNYWCYEKATYIGSDLRTISPLTMLRSAQGRCGEESTLAVAALRSIGIPARQVYTPRWAHVDDNHAWVEAWADGTWHYIGACEPEARLNQGWFSPPARRAMLVNTRIFASYPGPEDITLAHDWFTEINLLDNYAPTRSIEVSVVDSAGNSVTGAEVQFLLYNMAELFPIATIPTDSAGKASFRTGFGDLLIRAAKDGVWGEVKNESGSGDSIRLMLDQSSQPAEAAEFDLVPPPERDADAQEPVSEAKLKRHQERMEEGAAIRKRFEATFLDEAAAAELANSLGLSVDRLWAVLSKARGNSGEIAAFLRERSPEWIEWSIRLLESMNGKDLLDTFRPTLEDHLTGALAVRGDLTDEQFVSYVLCPRIQYEMIVPYRSFFQNAFTEAQKEAYQANPSLLASVITEGWTVWEDLPNLHGRGNPVGTYSLKAGDRVSLDILFVAISRSLGIPARLHPSEQKPQYWAEGEWTDAFPAAIDSTYEASGWGFIRMLQDEDSTPVQAPAASYAENFTVARLENGVYRTLLFPDGMTDVYGKVFEAQPGAYRLTTGIRLKDGTVRARLSYFDVRPGETTDLPLVFRYASADIPVLGTADLTAALFPQDGSSTLLGDLAGAKGAFVAWIEAEREPSKHLIRELGELSAAYINQGLPVILAAGDQRELEVIRERLPQLPAGASLLYDPSFAALTALMPDYKDNAAGFPHIFVLDGQGGIRYRQSGYHIGSGKEALHILEALDRPQP